MLIIKKGSYTFVLYIKIRVEDRKNKNEETKQAYSEPQFSLKIYYQKQLD